MRKIWPVRNAIARSLKKKEKSKNIVMRLNVNKFAYRRFGFPGTCWVKHFQTEANATREIATREIARKSLVGKCELFGY